jgi:type IV pilus assembly protein PilV
MVAIFIMSIGLLALAALELISKQSNFEAIQRTTAATLGSGIAERMRMNSVYVSGTSISALNYYLGTILNHTDTVNKSAGKPTKICHDVSDCSEQQLALWDLYEWKYQLAGANETNLTESKNLGGLLEPTACITGPAGGASGDYQITIAWRGKAKLTDANPANACGAGVYDDATGDNAYRRLYVLDTFLNVQQFD